jgi:hypothetical protein
VKTANNRRSDNMIRNTIILCTLLLAFCFSAVAFAKPDFSGSWVMDRARSFGLPGNMEQTMTVKQSGDQMEVETKLTQPNNERTQKDTYILDDKEYDFTPAAPPNQTPPKGKRSVKWLPNGDGIIVTEITTSETPNGPATTQVVKKWTFTAEGEVTIATFVDTATISYEAKRIFVRKKQ